MYDLIIKGGFLVDPSQEIEGGCDVGFEKGKVAAVDEEIDEKDGREIYDASGCLVTPGLIDLHTHVYWGVSHYGVDADSSCLSKGATTVIDAGTAGALVFPGFKKFIIEKSSTRIFAYLNISSIGLTSGLSIGELEDFRNLDFDKAIEVGREYKEAIIGIKIRLNKNVVGNLGPQALILAKEAAKRLGVPLMVHPGILPENLPLSYILSLLEEGDIVTHCFPPPYPPLLERSSLFNQKEEVIEEAWDAVKRGIFFDVGHGKGSFNFSTAERALEQGFKPTTISTDLHAYSIKYPVYDLPTTLSKFMKMGLSLKEVIGMSTANASSVIGMGERIGTLKKGAEGDAVVMQIEKGEFTFWDVLDKTRGGRERLKTVAVFKGGKLISKS